MFWRFIDWAVRAMCKIGIHNWHNVEWGFGTWKQCVYCYKRKS